MSPPPALSTRPDPWRLLRLALALAVVVILTLLVSVEAPDWPSIPEAAVFQLLIGAASAFAALVVATARRGFRGSPAVSLAFALAAGATATAIPIIAIHDWEPATAPDCSPQTSPWGAVHADDAQCSSAAAAVDLHSLHAAVDGAEPDRAVIVHQDSTCLARVWDGPSPAWPGRPRDRVSARRARDRLRQ